MLPVSLVSVFSTLPCSQYFQLYLVHSIFILALFSIFYLLLFTLHVLYHGRQVEIASSLDFLWKQQARFQKHLGTESPFEQYLSFPGASLSSG